MTLTTKVYGTGSLFKVGLPAGQEIFQLLWKPKAHYLVHNSQIHTESV